MARLTVISDDPAEISIRMHVFHGLRIIAMGSWGICFQVHQRLATGRILVLDVEF